MEALQLALRVTIDRAFRNNTSQTEAILHILREVFAGLCTILFMKHGLAGMYAHQWIRRISQFRMHVKCLVRPMRFFKEGGRFLWFNPKN